MISGSGGWRSDGKCADILVVIRTNVADRNLSKTSERGSVMLVTFKGVR